jgi:hypothetical protein
MATRAQWTKRIRTAARQAAEHWISLGKLLIAAKADPKLPHGEFLAMIRDDLPFGPRTAQMLMRIARDTRFTKAKLASHLPAAFQALYELTKLDDESLEAAVSTGAVTPAMTARAALTIVKMDSVRGNNPATLVRVAVEPSRAKTVPILSADLHKAHIGGAVASLDNVLHSLRLIEKADVDAVVAHKRTNSGAAAWQQFCDETNAAVDLLGRIKAQISEPDGEDSERASRLKIVH